jgi:hypothetical protein
VCRVNRAQHTRRSAVDDAVLLPATEADDFVAALVVSVSRLDYFTNRAALHHCIERLRRGVAFGGIHAPPHVRVHADEVMTYQHLPVSQCRQRRFDETKVFGHSLTARTGHKKDLRVHGDHINKPQSEISEAG